MGRRRPPDSATDEALVARCGQGDPAAWDALVRRHGGAVWATARGAGLPDDRAADAVQATFDLAWRNLDLADRPGSFTPWLAAIAAREAGLADGGRAPADVPAPVPRDVLARAMGVAREAAAARRRPRGWSRRGLAVEARPADDPARGWTVAGRLDRPEAGDAIAILWSGTVAVARAAAGPGAALEFTGVAAGRYRVEAWSPDGDVAVRFEPLEIPAR